jgi:D-alanyl-D-alanine dipeptidase
MHERGLAIDFTCGDGTVRLGDQCSRWLLANSKRFGLTNWPQESWHYSSNGH